MTENVSNLPKLHCRLVIELHFNARNLALGLVFLTFKLGLLLGTISTKAHFVNMKNGDSK